MQAARRSQRDPADRWGPEWPLPEPAGCGRRGRPFWVLSPLGWVGSPAGRDAEGAPGGRASGRRAGLSFVRGFARRSQARAVPLPLLALSGAGPSLWPGARWAWARGALRLAPWLPRPDRSPAAASPEVQRFSKSEPALKLHFILASLPDSTLLFHTCFLSFRPPSHPS